ncbi:MAG: DUF4386 domain-containing protein [Vulcanimicrobiaceae bacterium]
MTDRAVETSPQAYARIGGVLYLIIIVAGLFAEIFVRDKLIVSGDATATANTIMAHESLFRISVAIEQIWLVCAVGVALILYVLLKPVSENLALLAAFFNLVSIAVEGVATVSLFAALFLLGGAGYLKAFEPHQLHALAYLSLKVYDYGFATSLVFFGCCLFLYGYLIFRSGYFPKTLGVLLIIGSLSYLTNSFALFLAPKYAAMIFPILLLPFIAETSLCLWLIVKGVNVPKWETQIRAGPA